MSGCKVESWIASIPWYPALVSRGCDDTICVWYDLVSHILHIPRHPEPLSLHNLCLNIRPVMKTMRLFVMTHHLYEAHIWGRWRHYVSRWQPISGLITPLQFWREIQMPGVCLASWLLELAPCWLTSEYKHTGCFIITGPETFKTIKDIVNR